MPTTSPVNETESDNGLHLGHRAMYYVIRPVVKRLPVRVFVALSMLAAIPLGTLRAIRRAEHYGRILHCCGHKNTLLARIRLAVLGVYAKARHLERYVYERTTSLVATWDGAPETEPCVYFLANTYGSEAIAAWMDRYPAVIVRRAFAGERQLDPANASPAQMWRAFQAKMRYEATAHRHVVVGDNPMAYRPLLDGRTSVIIFQDLWDLKKNTGPVFLGSPATLMTGSLRISKLAGGLPLRFMTISPKGRDWHIHVGPRLPATYDTIATHIESDIRARPAEWMLWNEWFEFIDSRN
jgi:hypothetical protein